MPRITLTDLTLRSLRSDGAQVDYWDRKAPGFGVRVGKNSKTFIAKIGNRRITIGPYGDKLSLAEARKKASGLKSQYKPSVGVCISFGEAVDTFLATHCAARNKPSTKYETERVLKRHFLSKLRSKRLDTITHHDLAQIIDALLKTPAEANHAFKSARTLFRWAIRRHYISISPLAGMQMPARQTPRDRVLSDVELVSVWRAAARVGHPFGAIVQLLILTGQRRSEIGSLRWEQINEKEQTITLTDTKNGRPHTFPYNGMVTAVLETVPRLNTTSLLFPARGTEDTPFNGWSKAKENLERLPPIKPWTLHDLRRTFATNLAGLRVPIHVTEKLLNHVSGTMGGIVAIYQRHAFMSEMHEAIEKWEARLRTLLASP